MDSPRIRVEFELDKEGKPIVVHAGDKNHYKLRLSIDDAPDDTHAVTYQLHETYYDPVREVRGGTQGFQEEITSYGDFVVTARVRQKKLASTVSASLTRALKETYKNKLSAEIKEAIGELEKY